MEHIFYIFSYWIFLWYLLYFFGIMNVYNPKFAIIIGLFENLVILSLMVFYNTKYKLIFLFIIMMIILKIIPIYSIRNTKIYYQDIMATIFLFLVYLLFMFFNNKNFYDFTKQMNSLIFDNKNTLPGMIFLEKLGF